MDFKIKEQYEFEDLLAVMRVLRSENGCKWDREQNHKSIRRNFIEEVYEACEAIDNDDNELLKEELGDVLLQVVFHTRMEEELGNFNIDDVCDTLCKKLIFRHPHIFADVKVSNTEEILKNWEELKKEEKGRDSVTDNMRSVAKSLPALIRAEKISKHAGKVGFDFDDAHGALLKVSEEVKEISCAIDGNGNIEEELGDLLFAVVNLSRQLKIDPENALVKASDKFVDRFSKLENKILAQDKKFSELTLEEMDEIWNNIKNVEVKHEKN